MRARRDVRTRGWLPLNLAHFGVPDHAQLMLERNEDDDGLVFAPCGSCRWALKTPGRLVLVLLFFGKEGV